MKHATLPRLLLTLIGLIGLISPLTADTFTADDSRVVLFGRTDTSDPTRPSFYWSGTGFRVGFEGTSLTASITDLGDNYVYVTVNGGTPTKIDLSPGTGDILLASGLADANHEVEVFKITENADKHFILESLTTDAGKNLLQGTANPTPKIEFYGDSITAGYGVDNPLNPNDGTAASRNHYKAYSATTSRLLGADHRAICWSGAGIASGHTGLIPNVWDRTNAIDATTPTAHNFSSWQADLVIVNLLENDRSNFGYDPTNEYKAFIESIRGAYPSADILCILGPMDAAKDSEPWKGYIMDVVSQLNTAGDNNVYYHFFDNFGSNHPTEAQNAILANQLVSVITSNDYGGFGSVTPPTDRFTAIDVPTTVNPGQTYTLTFDYEAAGDREIHAFLQLPPAYSNHGNNSISVSAGTGQVSFDVTIDPAAAPGSSYYWKTEIIPAGGTPGSDSLALGWDIWAAVVSSTFSDANADGIDDQWATDNSVTDASADQDGDGLSNFQEYVFGADPNTPNVSEKPSELIYTDPGDGKQYLAITFKRRTDTGGTLTYTVQTTNDLTSASWETATFNAASIVNNGDGTETVTISDATELTTGSRFIRVHVSD